MEFAIVRIAFQPKKRELEDVRETQSRYDPKMPIRQIQLQCATCSAIQPHNQPMPNHIVHAIVSLFLLGLWIPVWIIIAIGSGKDPATCVKCGNRRAIDGAATVMATPAEVKATSKTQLVIMFGVMALLVIGLLIYDQMNVTEFNR